MSSIKRLFYDIEVGPGVYWAWRPGYNINLSYKNQLKEASMICVSWKWEGKKKVSHLTWDSNQCDKKMIAAFIKVLESADEICGHNSDAFDLKWVRTRAIKHGLDMSPRFVAYDTWREAKKMFRFDSGSLDYITRYLGVSRKLDTGGSVLWTDVCFSKDAGVRSRALKKMVKYCNGDVVAQAEVFDKMKPYLIAKSSAATFRSSCPECNSDNVRVAKRRITASGSRQIQFQCQEAGCGRYHQVPESVFNKGKAGKQI